MPTHPNRFDRIPDHVLDKIVTRIAADLNQPKWCCVCRDRPAKYGEFCHVCQPDDNDFEGQ